MGYPEAVDFLIAHDQVVPAAADSQDGVEHPGIDLQIHGSGRGQGEVVQIGWAHAGAATGVGEGGIHLAVQGCGLPA